MGRGLPQCSGQLSLLFRSSLCFALYHHLQFQKLLCEIQSTEHSSQKRKSETVSTVLENRFEFLNRKCYICLFPFFLPSIITKFCQKAPCCLFFTIFIPQMLQTQRARPFFPLFFINNFFLVTFHFLPPEKIYHQNSYYPCVC